MAEISDRLKAITNALAPQMRRAAESHRRQLGVSRQLGVNADELYRQVGEIMRRANGVDD